MTEYGTQIYDSPEADRLRLIAEAKEALRALGVTAIRVEEYTDEDGKSVINLTGYGDD